MTSTGYERSARNSCWVEIRFPHPHFAGIKPDIFGVREPFTVNASVLDLVLRLDVDGHGRPKVVLEGHAHPHAVSDPLAGHVRSSESFAGVLVACRELIAFTSPPTCPSQPARCRSRRQSQNPNRNQNQNQLDL